MISLFPLFSISNTKAETFSFIYEFQSKILLHESSEMRSSAFVLRLRFFLQSLFTYRFTYFSITPFHSNSLSFKSLCCLTFLSSPSFSLYHLSRSLDLFSQDCTIFLRSLEALSHPSYEGTNKVGSIFIDFPPLRFIISAVLFNNS